MAKVRNAFRKVNETRTTDTSVNTRRFLATAVETPETEIPTELWDNAFDDWVFGRVA